MPKKQELQETRQQEWENTEVFFESSSGERLFIQQKGKGNNILVALHGWNGNHRSFDSLHPYLPKDWSLWVVDLPGVGFSTCNRKNNLAKYTKILAEWFDSLEQSVTLVGNCSGALFGLQALVQTERKNVHRFWMIETFAFFPWYFRIFTIPWLGAFFLACSFGNPLGRWLTECGLSARKRKTTQMVQGNPKQRIGDLLFSLRMLSELSSFRQWKECKLPVHFLYGQKTFSAVKESVVLWKENWPQMAVYEIPQCGHLPMTEEPAQVASLLFPQHPQLSASFPDDEGAVQTP